MAEDLVPLEGSTAPNRHPKVGDVDPHDRIELTLKLRRKTEEGLPTLDEFTAGKRAKLSREALLQRYGADPADAAAVQRWAVGQGLSSSRTDLGLRQMHLVGSVAAVSKAFGVKLSKHRHLRTGVIFRSPDADVQVPKPLADIITGVFGLDDRPVVVRQTARVARRPPVAADPKTLYPGCFYPTEVARLYEFPATTGVGQRVAILEFGGGFDQTALTSYFTGALNLATPPTVNAIMVLDAKMDIGGGATGEVYLDIEVVGGMAPAAVIDVYFAPWSGEGYLNAIDQAIHNDDYAAVSISYGIDEDLKSSPSNPGWPMLNKTVDEAFQDASAIGLPLFVSSGDQGSGNGRGGLSNGEEVTYVTPEVHASYPASSPYATAVGGTMLYAENGAISHEVVWNELGQVQTGAFQDELGEDQDGQYYFGGATGGGVSSRYPNVPSYQTGAGIDLQSANTPPVKGRCIPDVAGNAGASTGYLVTQPPGSQASILPVGGTSAAAPMWAALMACVREALSTAYQGKVPIFFFNDFVYACGDTTAFRDIVEGREFSYSSQGGVAGAYRPAGDNRSSKADGYTAAAGYDLCTGWGSPNGAALLDQLQTWLKSQPAS